MKSIRKISVVIVEDEAISNDELKYIVLKDNRFNVVAQAYDGIRALEIIIEEEPEIVFIDINIPGKGGVELAQEIKKVLPDTILIFSTAYDKYAIKAFELKAYDYILKPYDENRIKDSLNSLASTLYSRISKIDTKSVVNKIPCENNGRIVLIDIDKICFCYSEGEKNYAKTDKEIYYTSKTLNELLEKTHFFRCHRSYIVNLNRIKEVYSWFNGTYKIIVDDRENNELPVSRSHVKEMKQILGI